MINSILVTGASSAHSDDHLPHTAGSSFVNYHLTSVFGDGQTQIVKRRYSDFEQLHSYLTRMYPWTVIPPLPEKHTLLETIVRLTSIVKREDPKFMEKRKRLLQSFLLNCLENEFIKQDKVFCMFLQQPTPVWQEAAIEERGHPFVMLNGSFEHLLTKYNNEGLLDARIIDLVHSIQVVGSSLETVELAERDRVKKMSGIFINFFHNQTLTQHPKKAFMMDYASLAVP